MKKSILRYSGIAFAGLCMLLLVLDPGSASAAASDALGICSGIILPSLLPFFFISGMISALGVPEMLAVPFSGLMRRLFGLSGCGAAPLLLGLLGGYPVGAAAVAELVERGQVSPGEGERLLPLCNNTGPAFIIGAVGGGIFSSPTVGALLYVSHILAAVSIGLLFSGKRDTACDVPTQHIVEASEALSTALTKSIRSAVEKSLNICGFVIFFSVLTAILEEMDIFSSAAIFLSRSLGLEIGFCRSLLCGIMELGGGIASMGGLSPCPASYALAAFILGFGSLSVHCQTLAVVNAAKLKCARHFAGRILHGLLSALYIFVLSLILRI